VQLGKSRWSVVTLALATGTACTQAPSGTGAGAAAAESATMGSSHTIGGVPVTIHCGDGKEAFVRQVSLGGRAASQVDCVAARADSSRELRLIDDELPVPAAAPAPVAVPAVVRERVIVREEPRRERRTTVRRKRPGAESALIIGGSTAAGAGVGAVLGGKKGAIVGAILGGVGGTVYDRTTRDRNRR
jgi:hypothetical protein